MMEGVRQPPAASFCCFLVKAKGGEDGVLYKAATQQQCRVVEGLFDGDKTEICSGRRDSGGCSLRFSTKLQKWSL